MLNNLNVVSFIICFMVCSLFYLVFLYYAKRVLSLPAKKSKKEIFVIIIVGILYSLIYILFNNMIRVIFDFLIFIISFKIIYNKPIFKVLLIAIMEFIFMCLLDSIIGIIFYLAFNDRLFEVSESNIIFVLANLPTIILLYIIIKVSIKNFEKFINWCSKRELIMNSIFLLTMFGIIFLMMYRNIFINPLENNFIINSFIIILIGIILVMIFRENYKTKFINQKYLYEKGQTKSYKESVNNYAMRQHENNNEWTVAYGLIQTNAEKAKEYISKVSKTPPVDTSYLWYQALDKIEDEGLRMLIYSKIECLENIKTNINISVELNDFNVVLNKFNVEEFDYIYKMVGVFLDNSIDAVKESIDKCFNCEIYDEDNVIYIVISNSYKEVVNGKSTKGKGHGYGLKLVESMDKNFSNIGYTTTVSGKLFTQEIKAELIKR